MSNQIVNLKDRIEKLEQDFLCKQEEYDKGIEKILSLLQQIQDALLGKIDKAEPGLLEEIRYLKTESQKIKVVQKELEDLQAQLKLQKEITDDVVPLKKIFSNQLKWKIGFIMLIGWFIFDRLVDWKKIFGSIFYWIIGGKP